MPDNQGAAHFLVVDGNPGSSAFHTVVADILIEPQLVGLIGAGADSYAVPVYIAVNPILNRAYVYVNDSQSFDKYLLATVDLTSRELLAMQLVPFADPGWGPLIINASANRIYVRSAAETIVIEDRIPHASATEAGAPGQPVVASFPQASIEFSSVTAGGVTQVQQVQPADLDVALPGGYVIDGALAYEITTTASVSAPITLCFYVPLTDDSASRQVRTSCNLPLEPDSGGTRYPCRFVDRSRPSPARDRQRGAHRGARRHRMAAATPWARHSGIISPHRRASMTQRISLLLSRSRDGHLNDDESVDSGKVSRVARVDRQVVREGSGGDQSIKRASVRLASGPTQRQRHTRERSSGLCVERQCLEIGFCLLHVRLARCTFVVARGQ